MHLKLVLLACLAVQFDFCWSTAIDVPQAKVNSTGGGKILLRRRRALERYNEVTLEGVPEIAQQNLGWCGPAVAEATLRYFGLNLAPDHQQYQAELARRMKTTTADFTSVSDFTFVLNQLLDEYSGHRLRYTATAVPDFPPRSENKRFYKLVHDSLESNMPVIVGYRGSRGTRLCRRLFRKTSSAKFVFYLLGPVNGVPTAPLRPDESHFILIYAIKNDRRNGRTPNENYATRPEDLIYKVMDPDVGAGKGNLDAATLPMLFTASQGRHAEGGYVISYIPTPSQPTGHGTPMED